MYISKIQSFNFSGNFYNNKLLTPILNEADNYELKRFSDILNRMVKIDDQKNYTLSTRKDFYTKTKEIFLHDVKNETFYTSITSCDINKNFSYANCLKRLNIFLESIYPQPKTTNIPRKLIISDINEVLK